MPPRTTARARAGPTRMRAASVHAPVENWVGEGDQRGGTDHGARVVALRVVDLLGDGTRVVPAHVVPHGDGDGGTDVRGGDGKAQGTRAVAVPRPESSDNEDDEGSEKDAEENDRPLADGFGAGEVPDGASEDDGERPDHGAMARRPGGSDAGEVGDENGWVDSHVEDAGGERHPGLLEAPEATHGAANPDVVAALVGDGAGELADHERGGERPDKRDNRHHDKGTHVAGLADDVFEAVRSAGDHEVGRGHERQEAELVAGGMFGSGHRRRGVRCKVYGGGSLGQMDGDRYQSTRWGGVPQSVRL
jgi:hypothetical protein